MRHCHTVTDHINGLVKISLCQCSKFSLSFRIVQQDFSIAENRKVASRTVVTVYLSARSSRILYKLDRLVTGYADRQVRSQNFSLADTVIPRSTDSLSQTRIAIFHFFGERHFLPSCTVGKRCSVFHQVGIDQFAGQSHVP